MKNKRLITKILLTIVAIALMVGAFFAIRQKPTTKEKGVITVEIIDLDGTILRKDDLEFEINETLVMVLKRNYDVIIKKGFLYKIDVLHTPTVDEYFIRIDVNHQMSNYGIEQIDIKDQDIVTFKLTKVGEYE